MSAVLQLSKLKQTLNHKYFNHKVQARYKALDRSISLHSWSRLSNWKWVKGLQPWRDKEVKSIEDKGSYARLFRQLTSPILKEPMQVLRIQVV